MSNKFKLRAECAIDIFRLLKEMPEEFILGVSTKLIANDLPDMELEIELKELNLVDLKAFCGFVTDGHVMKQTAQLEKDYTGERDFNA